MTAWTSCRATVRGIHAAADGVVAYAGWNPWDEEGRAWIMVLSHPDGYVTRYGHLIAGGLARVGQFVRQGEAIGRMGNTGKSTGTHLHFELLRDDTTVNPWAYLPAGMVTMKVARHHAGHGRGTHRRGARGARGNAHDGQRRAGSGAALDGQPPPASDAPPNGQVVGVDLAPSPVIPAVGAAPTVACPAASGTMSGHRDRAKGSPRMAQGGPRHHQAKGGKGGGAHDGRRHSRSERVARPSEGCVSPSTISASTSHASGGSGGAAAEDSAGWVVRGRVERSAPDTGSAIGRDSGVRLARRGTSPVPA